MRIKKHAGLSCAMPWLKHMVICRCAAFHRPPTRADRGEAGTRLVSGDLAQVPVLRTKDKLFRVLLMGS